MTKLVRPIWVQCPQHKPRPDHGCRKCREAAALNGDQLRRIGRVLTAAEHARLPLSVEEIGAAYGRWSS